MSFLTNLFGGEPNIWTVGFALIIVLVLIVAGVWLLKVIFNASGSIARGRQKRLAIVDTMAIDNKNNLVLIRRDDVEHLVIISSAGGTLVEAGIQSFDIPNVEPVTKESKISAPIAAVATTGAAAAAIASSTISSDAADNTASATKTTSKRSGLARMLRRTPKTAPADPSVDTPKPNLEPIELPKAAKIQPAEQAADQQSDVSELQSSVTKLDPQSATSAPPSPSHSLRHTGLLKPVSQMVGANSVEQISPDSDKDKPSNDDSAMKEAERIDSEAMESIEEGAVPLDDAVKAKKSGGKSKPQNKSQKKNN